jgi:hypothetical protein
MLLPHHIIIMAAICVQQLLQAIGDLSDNTLALDSALFAADFAHATLTNAGNNSWVSRATHSSFVAC